MTVGYRRLYKSDVFTLTEINFYPFHEFLSRKHRKILKKHITFSKNIMEIGRLQYHFSKIDFRGLLWLCIVFVLIQCYTIGKSPLKTASLITCFVTIRNG